MTKFRNSLPGKKPLANNIGNITETDLYEYAFPSKEIKFEVVKIVSTIVTFIVVVVFDISAYKTDVNK